MPGGRPAKSKNRTPFGQRLFEARQLKGLSQSQVADQLGITQPSYADWERSAVSLKPEMLPKLASLLGVSVDYLLGTEQKPRNGSGPVGKSRKIFEEVSKLSRHQQQRILGVVEDMLAAQHSNKTT